jgi:NACHT domain
VDWINAPGSSLLWICGPPGTGKTILAGSIVQRVTGIVNRPSLEGNVESKVLYFFCDKKGADNSRCTAISAIRSLLFQLWESTSNKDDFNVFWHTISQKRDLDRFNYLAQYTDSVIELLGKIPEIFIIIDAADECTDRQVLLSELLKIYNLCSASLKLLFTSRPEVDLLRDLRNMPTLELAPVKTAKDIPRVVESMVDESIRGGKLRLRVPGLRDEIISSLVNGANGMYLPHHIHLTQKVSLGRASSQYYHSFIPPNRHKYSVGIEKAPSWLVRHV